MPTYLSIEKAKYIDYYKIKFLFNDGKEKVLDFPIYDLYQGKL